MIAFRGQKRLGLAQTDLLQGFNLKFPTSIHTPYIWESLPVSKRAEDWYDRDCIGFRNL